MADKNNRDVREMKMEILKGTTPAEHQDEAMIEALRQSHERLLTVLNSMDSHIYIADMDTFEVLFTNEYGRRTWGETIGHTCWEVLQEGQDGPCPFCTNDKLLRADGSPADVYKWEFRNTRNGRWYDCRDRAIQWTDGRMVRMEIATDITEKKQADEERKRTLEALQASEAKYRLMTEKMNDIVWMADLNLRTFFNSPSLEKLLGYTEEERNRLPVEEMVTPASLSLIQEVFARELAMEEQGAADPDRAIVLDIEYCHKDGSTRWLENLITGIRDDRGVLTGIHGVSRDITERKAATEAVRESEERYRTILNTIQETYYEADLKGNLTFFNNFAVSNLGYNAEEMKGMNFRNFVDSENAESIFKAYHQVYVTGEPITGVEWVLITRNGTRMPVESSVSLRRSAAGEPVGFRGVVRNISERKRTEREREAAIEALRERESQLEAITNSAHDALVSQG